MYIQSQSVTFTLLWILKGSLSIRLKPFSIFCGFYDGVSMFWSSFTYCTETQEEWHFLCCVTGNSSMHLTVCWLWECCCSSVQLQTFIHTLNSNSDLFTRPTLSGSVRRSSSPSKLYKIPTCIYKAVQNNLNDLRLLCFHFSKAVLYLS